MPLLKSRDEAFVSPVLASTALGNNFFRNFVYIVSFWHNFVPDCH